MQSLVSGITICLLSSLNQHQKAFVSHKKWKKLISSEGIKVMKVKIEYSEMHDWKNANHCVNAAVFSRYKVNVPY